MHEGQVADGGIFVHGGPGLRDGQSIARLVLPIESLARLVRESELPGVELVPPARGVVVLRLAAQPEDGLEQWRFEGVASADGLRAEIDGYEDLPDIESTWQIEGLFDLAASTLAETAVFGHVLGFETRLSVDELAFDNYSRPVGLAVAATLDLAEATRALAATAGGDPAVPDPLTGRLGFHATATTIAPGNIAADWTFDFQPGTLATLEPFAPWPGQLGPAPRDLSPLAYSLRGTIHHDVTQESTRWTFEQTSGDLAAEVTGAGEYNSRTGTGNATLRKVVELGEVSAAFGDVLDRAAGLRDLTGRVVFETESGIANSVTFLTKGQFLVDDLGLSAPSLGAAIDGERVLLEWDAEVQLPDAAATIHRLSLETAPLRIVASGLLSPGEVDFESESTFDFDALAERGLLPVDFEAAGTASLQLTSKGSPNEVLDIDVALDLDEAFQYHQEHVAQFADSAALRMSTSLRPREEPLRFIALDVTELSLGEGFLGTLSIEWIDGNILSGVVSLEGALAPLLAIPDPELLAASGIMLLAEGDTLLRSTFTGALARDEALGWQPIGEWIIDGDVAMDVSYAEWDADFGGGLLEGATLSHQFRVGVPADQPTAFALDASGTIAAERMEDVAGLSLSNVRTETVLVLNPSSLVLTVQQLATDGGRYAMDGMSVRVPAMSANADARWNPATETANLVMSLPEGSDVLEGDLTAQWRGDIQRWEASGYLAASSLGALAQMVEFNPPLALPPILGAARLTFDAWGGIPTEAAFASGFLPIGGTVEWDVAVDEIDGGLDYQLAGFISAGRIAFEEEEGRILAEGRALLREFANLSLRSKPLREVEAEFTADFAGFHSIAWDLADFRIGNYGTNARANGTITDLDRALADTASVGLARWLQNIAINGRLRGEQDLAGFTGFLPLLSAGGVLDLSYDFRSAPGAAILTDGLIDLRNVELHWGDLFHLEGVNGSWEFAKSILLGETARRPTPPPAGVFTIDRIAFGLPPFMSEMRDSRATIRGLEAPMTLDMTSRGFIGGTASANALLRVANGDPMIEARLQATGIDIARVALPDRAHAASRREWEASAISLASWRLREVAGERTLEDLNVSLQSTRIGTQAFARLLQAMDPEETDPSIQQSRSALRLGTPTAARANMRGGLISFDADLRMAAGIQTVVLPILNRQPIGDLLEVYQLRETMAVMPLARWGILLLMAEDLDTLERTLMQGGGTP